MFSYTVVEGDLATDGVSIEANRLSLNGGTIKDGADNDAVLDHDVVAADSGHKVDGVKPRLQSATVNEAELTLAYGEALDGSAPPAAEDFTVNVEGAGRSVSGVSVSGRAVTLTLALAVEHGEVVAVSYGPGTNPIQDAAGNAAEGLSGEQVTNNTEAPNTAPEITSPGSFDVIENQARVTWLTATDADEGDEVTGWAITGGADRGRFAVVADTGELSFRANPDFEAPSDVLSTSPPSDARDNEYIVVVRATTGAGDRDLMAEQPIRVRVADEDEPPGKPEPTTFSEEMRDNLTVRWTEPENIGPDITNYDVRYQEGGGGFTDAQHEGTGLTATLTGLSTGTAYQVQVRASNEKGMSDWSEPGEGRTIAPLTVQMTPFPPPPVEAQFAMRFSFSEEVNGFTSDDIAAQQEPPCTDSENNPVSCNPSFTALQTTDDRIFTTAVTPRTERVAHNYTLTISVQVGGVTSLVGNKPNEAATLEVRIAPPGVTVPISSIGLTANPGNGQVTLRWDAPTASGGSAIILYEYRWAETGGEFGGGAQSDERQGLRVRGAGGERPGLWRCRDGDGHAGGWWLRQRWRWRWRWFRGWRRKWWRGPAPNGARRPYESAGERGRYGGDADVGRAGGRRRLCDYGLPVRD